MRWGEGLFVWGCQRFFQGMSTAPQTFLKAEQRPSPKVGLCLFRPPGSGMFSTPRAPKVGPGPSGPRGAAP